MTHDFDPERKFDGVWFPRLESVPDGEKIQSMVRCKCGAMWNAHRFVDGACPIPKPIKYVLCPGHVTSKVDGQTHFISANQLAMLYGVPMNECLVYDGDSVAHLGLIKLEPQYDGNYTLPEVRYAR